MSTLHAMSVASIAIDRCGSLVLACRQISPGSFLIDAVRGRGPDDPTSQIEEDYPW